MQVLSTPVDRVYFSKGFHVLYSITLRSLVLFCAFVLYLHGEKQLHGGEQRPNIIYIMLDDAGYGDFSPFGSKCIQTPAMERMCREGTKFTHHYSGSAVCAPTRCVLMTGMHTGHCRRRDNQAKANRDQTDQRGLVFLKDEDLTVAEVLQKSGYKTHGIGKWGLGNPGFAGQPEKQGFDSWFGYLDQVHAHDHYTDVLWDGGKMINIPENSQGRRTVYMHRLFEEQTLDFLNESHDQPFFLYLAYTLPHGKFEIPHNAPAYQPYAKKPWSQEVKNYAAMVDRADRTVGRILDALEENEIAENTIVFYTSDNGPNRQFLKQLNSGGGLRGIKRHLYEGGIRAPMVVSWPGKVPAGKTSEFVWGMRDVFPTLCELAGVELPAHLDGMSVVPTLQGKDQPSHKHLYWEYHSPFQQAVRIEDYKGFRLGTQEPILLFDLAKDPAETQNIAEAHPELVQRIKQIMDTSRTETPFWPAKEKASAQVKKSLL